MRLNIITEIKQKECLQYVVRSIATRATLIAGCILYGMLLLSIVMLQICLYLSSP